MKNNIYEQFKQSLLLIFSLLTFISMVSPGLLIYLTMFNQMVEPISLLLVCSTLILFATIIYMFTSHIQKIVYQRSNLIKTFAIFFISALVGITVVMLDFSFFSLVYFTTDEQSILLQIIHNLSFVGFTYFNFCLISLGLICINFIFDSHQIAKRAQNNIKKVYMQISLTSIAIISLAFITANTAISQLIILIGLYGLMIISVTHLVVDTYLQLYKQDNSYSLVIHLIRSFLSTPIALPIYLIKRITK